MIFLLILNLENQENTDFWRLKNKEKYMYMNINQNFNIYSS